MNIGASIHADSSCDQDQTNVSQELSQSYEQVNNWVISEAWICHLKTSMP